MKRMFQDQVVPRLRRLGSADRFIVHRKINLFGKGESDIETQAMDLTARGRVPEVGITAHDATISFRITGVGATEEEALRADRADRRADLRAVRQPGRWARAPTTSPRPWPPQLARTGSTLATAESCTGGLIAHMITAIPGVSPYYLGGVVTYANESKTELLGVPAELIEAHGAVSPEVAAAMAEGVRTRLGATIGISTTGVAGPGGGTPEKPVGLVYLGLSTAERHPDPTPRHGLRTPPRLHPDLLRQGRAQLGAIGPDRREIGSGRFANPGAGGRSERGYRL